MVKKTVLCLLVLFFLSGLPRAPLFGDLKDQTLDEVLAKNYQAHGGLERLKSLTARKMSGKIAVIGEELEMPVVLWQKAPDKLRMEAIFQDQKIVQAFDGQKAWWIMPFLSGKALEMPPEQGNFFRNQAVFENPLVVFREKGYKLELLGKEDLEGAAAFKLKLVRADGGEIFFYLDAASGLELKSAMSLKSGEADSLAEIIYGDFRDVGGYLLPFSVENKLDGKTGIKMTLDTIEVNPAMEDSLFTMPEAKDASVVEGIAPTNVAPKQKKEGKKSKKK
jgi:outer membrane lipoprotein-sorting protein